MIENHRFFTMGNAAKTLIAIAHFHQFTANVCPDCIGRPERLSSAVGAGINDGVSIGLQAEGLAYRASSVTVMEMGAPQQRSAIVSVEQLQLAATVVIPSQAARSAWCFNADSRSYWSLDHRGARRREPERCHYARQ